MEIWQYNVCHTNIFVMKDMIILKKTSEKKELSKGIIDKMALIKMAQASSLVDFARR